VNDPGHNHTVTDPGHAHTVSQMGGSVDGTNNFLAKTSHFADYGELTAATATTGITIASKITGITVGQQANASTDTGAFLAVPFIIKT